MWPRSDTGGWHRDLELWYRSKMNRNTKIKKQLWGLLIVNSKTLSNLLAAWVVKYESSLNNMYAILLCLLTFSRDLF